MGLDEKECELILNASPMHDVGKIGIPDNILLKPGKFEAEEWEKMKTHAEIGGEILSGNDSDLLLMARIIALTHHEKWDGSGYPRGLVGEDIPLVGRIVALADVFDALTSERPYKKAWPVDAAIEYINEQKGLHFDPKLVDLFNENIEEILNIRKTYAEPGMQT
jgi:putative two-component system response regulator